MCERREGQSKKSKSSGLQKIAEGVICGHATNESTRDFLNINMACLTFLNDKPLEELYGDQSYRVAVHIEILEEVTLEWEE